MNEYILKIVVGILLLVSLIWNFIWLLNALNKEEIEDVPEYECRNCKVDVTRHEILGNVCPSCMCGSATSRTSSWFKSKENKFKK